MKVKASNLFYGMLPSKKDKKKLMAADGMAMGNPVDPRIKNMVKTLPDDYFDIFGGQPKRAQTPGLAPIDKGTPNVQLPNQNPQQINPNAYNPGIRPPTNIPQKNPNIGNAIMLGLEAVDAAIPGRRIHNQQVIHPQEGYAPHPLGTGSSALMDDGGWMMNPARDTPIVIPEGVGDNMPSAKSGNWIKGAVNPKHKGYCTPMTKSTCTPRRKAFAKTMKKHHGFHKNGGIIPDNMSNFSPHEYENGGSVNFLENIMFHPNQADMAMYPDGGKVGPGDRYTPTPAHYYFGALGRIPTAQDSSTYRDNMEAIRTGSPYANESRQYTQDTVIPALTHSSAIHNSETADKLLGEAYTRLNAYNEGLEPGTMQLYLPKDTKKRKGNNGMFLENIMFHPNAADMQGFEDGGLLENIMYHPDMQDMRGWSKAKAGKQLSPGKAREMLHDKTAHGYALTDKQRKYFGAVASGYADMGMGVPGDPPTKAGQFNAENLIASQKSGYGDAETIDRLNNVLVTGNAARDIPQGYGADQRNLLQNAFVYRQQHPGMNPDQMLQGYYGQQGGSGSADYLRQKLGKIGYGPNAMYHSSSNAALQERQNNNTGVGTGLVADNTQSINALHNTTKLASGGMMYADGGEVGTMWGGNVEQISDNPHDGGTMQFNGQSHEDGGIGMHYNGNPVEVEGGETASRDSQGNLNIFGNMYLPGTRTKFKSVAKEIGQKEKRYDYLKTRGSELVNNSNPANKFEKLAFNAGKAMMSGGAIGQKDLAEKKDKLSSLQRAMLDTAAEHGIDAQHMSAGKIKKAKGGASIPFAEAGDNVGPGDPNQPGRSTRNNNPGNIKYGKWAKKYGASGKDADGFAIFPDKESGKSAMQNLLASKDYSRLSVKDAINKWTGGHPYQYNLDFNDKKLIDLNKDELLKLEDTMIKGEDTRYGAGPAKPTPPGNRVPPRYGIPNVPLTPDQARPTPPGATPPDLGNLNPPGRRSIPSNVEPLHFNEVAGELYAAATNKVEPVAMQKYDPQLYQPYQVSFQDRINQNQSSYNALQRTLGASNPAALNQIAAQKYGADSAVKAEEFRTNQVISDDITNKNIGLRNDAQMKNIGLADQQYVRQSTAKSKTKQLNQMIVNSLSSKYAQNELENKRLAAYENLYDYRFTPGEQGGLDATYFGPNASFNFNNNRATQQGNADIRTVSRFDQYGNPKGYTQYDNSSLRDQRDAMELEMKRRKLPLVSAPPLN